jgi:hypothetical protein
VVAGRPEPLPFVLCPPIGIRQWRVPMTRKIVTSSPAVPDA